MKTFIAAILGALVAVAASAQTPGATAEDYFTFETLGDPRFSPDGQTIAFVVTTVDPKANRRRSAIYAVPADVSREPVALTTAPHSSTSINWQVYWFGRYIDGNPNAAPPDAPARAASSTTQDKP